MGRRQFGSQECAAHGFGWLVQHRRGWPLSLTAKAIGGPVQGNRILTLARPRQSSLRRRPESKRGGVAVLSKLIPIKMRLPWGPVQLLLSRQYRRRPEVAMTRTKTITSHCSLQWREGMGRDEGRGP